MMWGYPLHGFGYGAGWFGMGFMMLFGLMATVGVILLIVWLVRGSAWSHATYPQTTNSACEIAKTRYAKGEITKEQYQDICRTVGV